jgi:hypothetical protein
MRLTKTKSPNSPKQSGSIKASPYSESGVDLTLIRWMLSLTPAERLQILQQTIRSILMVKGKASNIYKKGSADSQDLRVVSDPASR